MKKTFYFGLYFLLLSFLVSPLIASEVLVYRNESMPFCGTVNGKDAGMVVDILNEVTKQGGPKFKFKSLPWKRAQQYVQTNKGSAITPFTRTPSREKEHMWIIELFSYHARLTTAKNPKAKLSLPPLLSVDSAKHLPTGIILGSAHIHTLIALGFTDLIEINAAELSAKQLMLGNISVMVESQWVDTYYWKKLGMNSKDLIIGPSIEETKHVYLSAALDFPMDTAAKIRKAMKQVRNSGKLETIKNKWR